MSNTTNSSSVQLRTITGSELTVWIVAQFVIGIVGAVLTILLLIIMHRQQRLRRGSGLLIAHALSVDLIFCLVISPVTVIPIYLHQMDIPVWYNCVLADFFLLVAIYLGNWTAVVLAINRLIAIILPQMYTKMTSLRFTTCLLIFVWTITITCNIPNLNIVPGLAHGRQASGACGLIQNDRGIFTILGVLGTYLPVALLGALYSCLFVLSRFVNGRDRQNDAQRSLLKRKLAIAKALCLSFVWYCICILPPAVLNMYYAAWWNKEIRVLLYTRSAQLLGYAANPVFFFAVNAEYRAALRRLGTHCIFPKRRRLTHETHAGNSISKFRQSSSK
ncbi:melatonin receptor type 1B-A-like [Paramacrobiotus metropolitanus]|uniref:melatonin receptor type 1B-A-like n=1 Tax=Paramacrobiotus metropolitanus TaxID=2943436 RepID=UPI0024459B97|nr:melatonin receptor type 1B-A-like [Paramacrobiotus metropolitanus]